MSGQVPCRSALFSWARVAVGTAERPEAVPGFRCPEGWAGLLDLARRESLTPLLHHLFNRTPSPWTPPVAFLRAIERDYYGSLARYLRHAASFAEILEACRRAGIEPLVLKGMAVAESAYGNPALRPMYDLDLLVRRAEVPRARAVLGDLGYTEPPSLDDDLRWRAAAMWLPADAGSTQPAVDLHWDLGDECYGPAASRWADGVWERARPIAIGGTSARVLSATDGLLHACAHLAVHHGLRGLLWYCDLGMMVRAWRGTIAWQRLADRVIEARLTGAVSAVLMSAKAMLGLDVPASVLSRLRPRALRTRALTRWLLPRLSTLHSIPHQEYVVPLLLMDRGRDVTGLVLRRMLVPRGMRSARQAGRLRAAAS